MVIPMVFGEPDQEKGSSSFVIIFSCWNTMVGSAMVALPWAFQSSGLLFGIAVSFVSFMISFYTCALIIKSAKNDTDYIFTLKKYYGKPGYYMGLIGPTILIFGAITVYFVVIVQSLYPLLVVVMKEVFKMEYTMINPLEQPYCRLDTFSASYVALFEYVLLVSISMKRDLSIFLKLGSLGAFCVTTLIVFVVIYGFLGISDTEHQFDVSPTPDNPDGAVWQGQNDEIVTILLYNHNFSNLAGVLCAGYFIH